MELVVADVVLESAIADVDDPGGADPVNAAINKARHMNGPSSPDANAYAYEAVDHGGYYRVLKRGRATGTAVGERVGVDDAARNVRRGSFDDKRVVSHVVYDVAGELESILTVHDFRELGRLHGVSYERGSRKHELAEQFAEQAPEPSRRIVLGDDRG